MKDEDTGNRYRLLPPRQLLQVTRADSKAG